MLIIRLVGFLVGAVTFLAAHAVESARWHPWFHGEFEPWFLNSGRAILFTLGCVGVASASLAALSSSTRPVRGITIAAGAFSAMTYVMFASESGPGTIFPIVMAAGGTLILIASTLGAWIGREVRRAATSRR